MMILPMLAIIETKLAICADVRGPLPGSTSGTVKNATLAFSNTVACEKISVINFPC